MKFALYVSTALAIGMVSVHAQVPTIAQIQAPTSPQLAPVPLGTVGPQNCLGSLPMNGGALCGPLLISRTSTTSDDEPLLKLMRSTSHSGGSAGFVDFTQLINLTVNAGATNYEWALTSILNNYAAAGENVASYFQANKYGVGPTWSAVFDCRNMTTGTSTATGAMPCMEMDIGAVGLDDYAPYGLWGAISIGINALNTTTPTTIGWGVRLTADAYTTYRRGFSVQSPFSQAAFDTSFGTATSFGGVTAAAYRSASEQLWDVSGNSSHYWWLHSNNWEYVVNGVAVIDISEAGDITAKAITASNRFTATPAVTTNGFTVTGTTGAAGFDTSSATLASGALKIGAGQSICFEATCARTLSYSASTQFLSYTVGGTIVLSIDTSGNVTSTGNDTTTGVSSATRFVATPSATTNGFAVTGTTGATGFDTATATLSNAAIRIASGQKICLEITCGRALTYDSPSQNLDYLVGGVPQVVISAVGDVTGLGVFTGNEFNAKPTATTAAFNVTGTTGATGLDTSSATLSSAAIRIAAGQKICLEAACGSTLSYDGTSTSLRYTVSSVTQFAIDSGGGVTANSYKVGANAGLSCAGTPTASFASTNGIVTHC